MDTLLCDIDHNADYREIWLLLFGALRSHGPKTNNRIRKINYRPWNQVLPLVISQLKDLDKQKQITQVHCERVWTSGRGLSKLKNPPLWFGINERLVPLTSDLQNISVRKVDGREKYIYFRFVMNSMIENLNVEFFHQLATLEFPPHVR